MDLKNCLTTIKCEPKTRRLGKTKYNRPKQGTFTDSLQTKQKMAENIIFGDILRTLSNQRKGNKEITSWFTKKVIENGSVAKSYGGRKLNLDDSWSEDSESEEED